MVQKDAGLRPDSLLTCTVNPCSFTIPHLPHLSHFPYSSRFNMQITDSECCIVFFQKATVVLSHSSSLWKKKTSGSELLYQYYKIKYWIICSLRCKDVLLSQLLLSFSHLHLIVSKDEVILILKTALCSENGVFSSLEPSQSPADVCRCREVCYCSNAFAGRRAVNITAQPNSTQGL